MLTGQRCSMKEGGRVCWSFFFFGMSPKRYVSRLLTRIGLAECGEGGQMLPMCHNHGTCMMCRRDSRMKTHAGEVVCLLL